MADAAPATQDVSLFDLLRLQRESLRTQGLVEPSRILCSLVDNPSSADELDGDGQTPLHVAVCMQHPYEVVRAVACANLKQLETADSVGNLPLHEAVWRRNGVDTIKFLIDHHPKACLASENEDPQPLTQGGVKVQSSAGWLPLHYACGHGVQPLEVVLILFHIHPDSQPPHHRYNAPRGGYLSEEPAQINPKMYMQRGEQPPSPDRISEQMRGARQAPQPSVSPPPPPARYTQRTSSQQPQPTYHSRPVQDRVPVHSELYPPHHHPGTNASHPPLSKDSLQIHDTTISNSWTCMTCFVFVGGKKCPNCGSSEPDFNAMVSHLIDDDA